MHLEFIGSNLCFTMGFSLKVLIFKISYYVNFFTQMVNGRAFFIKNRFPKHGFFNYQLDISILFIVIFL